MSLPVPVPGVQSLPRHAHPAPAECAGQVSFSTSQEGWWSRKTFQIHSVNFQTISKGVVTHLSCNVFLWLLTSCKGHGLHKAKCMMHCPIWKLMAVVSLLLQTEGYFGFFFPHSVCALSSLMGFLSPCFAYHIQVGLKGPAATGEMIHHRKDLSWSWSLGWTPSSWSACLN